MKDKLFTSDINLWMYWCHQFDHNPKISKVYVTKSGKLLYEFDKARARTLIIGDQD
jgi:hypothetical protein